MLFVNDDDLTQILSRFEENSSSGYEFTITSNNLIKVPGGITRIHYRIDFVFVIKCFVLLSDFVLLHFQEPPLFIEATWIARDLFSSRNPPISSILWIATDIYQRSVWRITSKLPDPYPYKSPSIGFANKTYHPNVDKMLTFINSYYSKLCGTIN
nr:uncharacterized protein LOC103433205 isoform X1 [Malus domestica]